MADPIKTIEAPVKVVLPKVDEAPRVSEPMSPSTTEEQDRKTAGQREINLIWERTQMRIALWVIWSALGVAIVLSIFGRWVGPVEVQLAAIVFLFGVANLVTGFYFGRTNHQRTGGIGGDQAGSR